MEHTSLTPAVVPEEPAVARTLLEECLAFIAETGMSETYFGRLSCGNSELLKRMRRPGGERRISVDTNERVRAYMKEQRRLREQASTEFNISGQPDEVA